MMAKTMIAGFCVGIVEKDDIIDGSSVKTGDCLIGLASSGPHSNGYSLIRKIIETSNADLSQPFGNSTLGATLLEPTRIYVKSILALKQHVRVKAISHITGGGFLENIPRVLPDYTTARIAASSWQWPEVFTWLQENGNVAPEEMYRTFNCGIGMVLCVAEEDKTKTLEILKQQGETVYELGEIQTSDTQQPMVEIV